MKENSNYLKEILCFIYYYYNMSLFVNNKLSYYVEKPYLSFVSTSRGYYCTWIERIKIYFFRTSLGFLKCGCMLGRKDTVHHYSTRKQGI